MQNECYVKGPFRTDLKSVIFCNRFLVKKDGETTKYDRKWKYNKKRSGFN